MNTFVRAKLALDDEIDTIRIFDPESQRSLDKIDAIHLLPGRELPLDEASREAAPPIAVWGPLDMSTPAAPDS